MTTQKWGTSKRFPRKSMPSRAFSPGEVLKRHAAEREAQVRSFWRNRLLTETMLIHPIHLFNIDYEGDMAWPRWVAVESLFAEFNLDFKGSHVPCNLQQFRTVCRRTIEIRASKSKEHRTEDEETGRLLYARHRAFWKVLPHLLHKE